MRIVFLPIPGIGHAFPLVPTAWALAAAGHDVIFLATNDALEVRNAGIHVVDPMPGGSMDEGMAAFLEDAPNMFADMASWSVEQILGIKPMVLQPWDRYVDPYVEVARRLEPDLVFFDPIFAAGLIVASLLDKPAVGQASNLVRFTPEFLFEHANAPFARHGAELPKKRALIDVGPSTLLEPGPSTWQMRCVPYNGGTVLPDWLLEPPSRPRIAITLGTTLPRTSGTDRLRGLLASAAEVDAEFAVTISEAAAAKLGTLPDNVRATGWVPLHRLATTCTAIIHHGGSGTTLASCAAGIPQLILPEGADTDYNARVVESLGAGVLHRGEVDAAVINRLATDPVLAAGAAALRAENERLRTPWELVSDIEALVRD
ncbi:nucleotide disphospho-sugar-binding domain-containing protein [Dactylosporangium sp. NPDC051485]|uniref:nucleotide disphospho-sugar-binding domain-containing protein n=1 Tax=Dactylosporangium sp. NPDC051485 TaxID=3154846 RepID=UPI00343646B3